VHPDLRGGASSATEFFEDLLAELAELDELLGANVNVIRREDEQEAKEEREDEEDEAEGAGEGGGGHEVISER
jgi:hypothetical protein